MTEKEAFYQGIAPEIERSQHMAARDLKLSTRILRRMRHCPVCKGLGYYKYTFEDGHKMTVACHDCTDWHTALRGVVHLEAQVRKLKKDKDKEST